jgi:hypothetical protein
MSNIPLSEADQVRLNIQNIKDELVQLLLHKEVLNRLIQDCKDVFESKIVMPKITRNLSNISNNDLEIDLVPIKTASKEQLKARYDWHQFSYELADLNTNIEAKKELLAAYNEHLKQYFNKQATKITDEMIYDKLAKAQALKDLSPEEQKTLKGIVDELPKRLNGGKDARLELHESLQNLILQHG